MLCGSLITTSMMLSHSARLLPVINGRRYYYTTILGTDTITSSFIRDLKADTEALNANRSEAIRECVMGGKGELDHMESPEVDKKHVHKIERLADDLFSRIDLPADPMKAALAPSEEEVMQNEKFEVLKDIVRERYQSSNRRKSNERSRITRAMDEVAAGTYKLPLDRERETVERMNANKRASIAAEDLEKEALRNEVKELKARLAAMEKK
eukprot:Tbor_TRINITY_DN3732_c0_g1::TRINITY_DN3732_c0_g1_i1::g.2411::m.2411